MNASLTYECWGELRPFRLNRRRFSPSAGLAGNPQWGLGGVRTCLGSPVLRRTGPAVGRTQTAVCLGGLAWHLSERKYRDTTTYQ